MNIYTRKIGKLRGHYQQKEMLPLYVYIKLARKIIKYWAKGNKYTMLKNDDIIADVAHAMMMGDWRWNGQTPRFKYMNQCGIYFLKTMADKLFAPEEIALQEIENKDDIQSLIDMEDYMSKVNKVKEVMGRLSKRQAEAISLSMENKNIGEIARVQNISYNAAKKNLDRGTERIREWLKN